MCKYCDRISKENFTFPKGGDLRIWWYPQLGSDCGIFYYPVSSPQAGKTLLNVLAQYDLFQLEHNIKPDYSNAGGLEEYGFENENREICWTEWYNEFGEDIDEVEFK